MSTIAQRRRAATIAAVVAVVVIAVAVAILLGGSAGPQPGADTARSDLHGYVVTYRVEEPATGRRTQQVIEVERPYRARSRLFEADGTTLVGGNIWTADRIFVIAADGTTAAVQRVPPGRPGPDVRLDASLPAAVERGLARRGGTDLVAGIACTEYHTREPLDTALPAPPQDGDGTTSCVDASGRILRETWRVADQIIRTRTAVSVLDEASLDDTTLFAVPPQPVPDALEQLRELDNLAWPIEPPLGVVLPERIAGLPRDLAVALRDLPVPGAPGQPRRLTYRVTYTDGVSLVTVDLSRTLEGAQPPPPSGEPFSLAPLERAVLQPSFDGLALIGFVGDVRVEIRGPLTRAEVAAVTLTRP